MVAQELVTARINYLPFAFVVSSPLRSFLSNIRKLGTLVFFLAAFASNAFYIYFCVCVLVYFYVIMLLFFVTKFDSNVP